MKTKLVFLILWVISFKNYAQNCYYTLSINNYAQDYGYYLPPNSNNAIISACGGTVINLFASPGLGCTGNGNVYWYNSIPNSSGSNYFSFSNSVHVYPQGQTIYMRTYQHTGGGQMQVTLQMCGIKALPPTLVGLTNICSNIISSNYSGADDWQISDNAAGILTNNNDGTCTIVWNSNYIGSIQLLGRKNSSCTYCGYSNWSSPLIIDINPIPSSPIASNSGVTCVGNTLSLSSSSVTGATYSWTGPNGFTSSLQNPTVSDNVTVQMSGDYTVTATVNGCSNTPSTTSVILNQATINSNTTICEGTALSLVASNIPGASYFWTGPNSFSSTEQNPTVSLNTNSNMAGTYNVYTTANGCTSTVPGTIDIIVIPRPSIPIPNNNGPVCVGNNLSLSIPTILGATYQWTGPNGFSSTDQNPIISASASAIMGGIYNLTTYINGCSSDLGSTIVQINKIAASNNGPVCSGTTLSLGATAITGATYSWSGPNGFTSTDQNPIVSINSTSSMAGVYSATSTVNGCTSPSSVTIVSINSSPIFPIITQNGTVLHSSATTGNQWYSQNGIINGATNQNYTPTSSGNYYVVVTSSPCSSSSSVFNYTFLANEEFNLSDNLKIYPNPTNSKISIDNHNQTDLMGSEIRITNSLGQEIYKSTLSQQNQEVTLSSIANTGLYFVSIIDQSGKIVITKKIVLQ